MPKPELKTYAVSVPITVHVTYYVKAESVEEACMVDVDINDVVFIDSHGGLSCRRHTSLNFFDQVEWEEVDATDADPDVTDDMCVARQDVGEDEE